MTMMNFGATAPYNTRFLDYIAANCSDASFKLPADESERNHFCAHVEWFASQAIPATDKLLSDLRRIAPYWNQLNENPEDARDILKDERLLQVWDTYLKMEFSEDFDQDVLFSGEIKVFTNEPYTEEEEKVYSAYLCQARAYAEKKLGNIPFAYEVRKYARRVCTIMSYENAPQVILLNEEKMLQFFILLNYSLKNISEE